MLFVGSRVDMMFGTPNVSQVKHKHVGLIPHPHPHPDFKGVGSGWTYAAAAVR